MSDRMARAIEKIEGAVTKVVVGGELADLQTFGVVEINLAKIPSSIQNIYSISYKFSGYEIEQ